MNAYVYHLDEGAIRLPPGFRDASVNVFEWIEKTGPVALTIQREKREPDTRFEELFQKITAPYPKLFTAYAEEDPMEIAMDVPVLSKRFRWRQERGVVYHHQAFLDVGPTVMLLTAAGQAAARDRVDEVLHEALSGLQLRERAET